MKLRAFMPRSEEQKFGAVLATALGFFGVTKILKSADRMTAMLLLAACALAMAITIGCPAAIRPVSNAWRAGGKALGLVVSPLVLGAIFYGLITPLALTLRLFGRDELNMRRKVRDTYWIVRNVHSLWSDTFKRPF